MAKPRHEDPASDGAQATKKPETQASPPTPLRRAAEFLPPLIYFLAYVLFSIYVLSYSSLHQQAPCPTLPNLTPSDNSLSSLKPYVQQDISPESFTMSSAEQT